MSEELDIATEEGDTLISGVLTLRDYFAAKAMSAYLVASRGNPPEPDMTAEAAYVMADEMLRARLA
jgi:hypothetical protein